MFSHINRLALAGLGLVALTAEENPVSAEKAFSEAIGVMYSQRLPADGLDAAAFLAGFQKGLKGEAKPLSQEEFQKLQAAFMAAKEKAKAGLGTEWKKAQGLPAGVHDSFYADFIKMEGVKVTASGLAYKILKEGTGAQPKDTDTVKVHYTGRHTTGAVFDSSVERGEPTSFPLNQVIKGWTEGVQLMKVGSSFRFVIPGKLAYGELQEGSQRPTGVLVFDVELLAIEGGADAGGIKIKMPQK